MNPALHGHPAHQELAHHVDLASDSRRMAARDLGDAHSYRLAELAIVLIIVAACVALWIAVG